MLIGSLGLQAARFGAAGATPHAPPPPWRSPEHGGEEREGKGTRLESGKVVGALVAWCRCDRWRVSVW